VSARTQDKRLWLFSGAIVALLIVLLGWFFVIHPELTAASSNRDQAESARTQNIALEGKNNKLKAQNDDAAALRAGLAAALAELPYDSGLPEFTRQVSAQATEHSMVLSSIVVGDTLPVVGPTGDAVESTAATTDAATSLVAIPITVVATGLSSNQLAFLTALQVTGPRRALVTAVQIAPPSGGEAVGGDAESTMTLQLTVFSAPLTPAAQAELEKLLSGS
jgi:hypothetical protein